MDGDDFEFVLGSQRDGEEIGLYLLFFGQYDKVALAEGDKEVVYQAFKGPMVAGDHRLFVQNLCRDPELCKAFEEAYISTGKLILEDREMQERVDVMGEYEEYAEGFLIG